MKEPSRSVKTMTTWKRVFTQFCGRVDRRCARMNSGLTAVALVLAATTFFLSALRASEEIVRDDQLGKLPFIEMSTDGPDTGVWWVTD